MNVIGINRLIFKAINSQDKNVFCEVIDTLIGVPGIFRKKRYVWNIIRPRDIYKSFTYWLEINIEDDVKYQDILRLMHELIESTKSEKIRQSFIWGVMKKVNILTIDTIKYSSHEKIINVIKKTVDPTQKIYGDDTTFPIMAAYENLVESYKEEIDILRSLVE